MVCPALTPKGDEPQVTQREVMLRIVRECGGDEERAVHAYAAAERRGEVKRRRNRSNYTPEEYARALMLDGFAKGWLPRFSTDRGTTATLGRTGRGAAPAVRPVHLSDDLKGLRWKLIHLLNGVDRHRVLGEGIRRRIGRLSQTGGPIPGHIAALMVSVDEMRTSAECGSRVLSPSECAVLRHAWLAIEEWNDSQ